jgi:pimeloyl-ACP methyl ester carboxylesterase
MLWSGKGREGHMGTHSEEIVFAPSEDQRWMAGVLMRPATEPARSVGILYLHGSTGFFYEPAGVYLGRELAQRGYLFVSGNTRGHDVASDDFPWPFIHRPDDVAKYRLGGNSWARWDEEPYDVAGWINFLVSQGIDTVALIGHSAGGLRVLYYQALRQDPRVVGMVLASSADSLTPDDPARVELAERLVAEGRGDELLPLLEGQPMILAMESAGYLAHWNRIVAPFVADGHVPWIADIHVPVLATRGTMEPRPNLRALVEDMRERAVQAPRFDIAVIDGADHSYTGRERELAEVVARWLETLAAM